jgi:DNA-binding NarL/FixJ family response regulator
MKYYDIDSTTVWLILDEMEELLEGDQLLIFRALRRGWTRKEIAEEYGVSRKAINMRIYRIKRKIRETFQTLDLPRIHHLEDLF